MMMQSGAPAGRANKSDHLRDPYANAGFLSPFFRELLEPVLWLIFVRRARIRRRFQIQPHIYMRGSMGSLLFSALNKWPHNERLAKTRLIRVLIRFVVVVVGVLMGWLANNRYLPCKFRRENYFAPLSKNTQQVAKNTTDVLLCVRAIVQMALIDGLRRLNFPSPSHLLIVYVCLSDLPLPNEPLWAAKTGSRA